MQAKTCKTCAYRERSILGDECGATGFSCSFSRCLEHRCGSLGRYWVQKEPGIFMRLLLAFESLVKSTQRRENPIKITGFGNKSRSYVTKK